MNRTGFFHRHTFQLQQALAQLGWLLLPGHCVLCELSSHRQRDICRECESSLPWICLYEAVSELPTERLKRNQQSVGPLHGNRPILRDPTGHVSLNRESTAFRAAPVQVVAAFHYRAPVDGMLQRMKFHRGFLENRVLGTLLADRLMQLYQASNSVHTRSRTEVMTPDAIGCASQLGELPQVIMPIPLSWARLIRRGYNQAGILANRLSQLLGIPVDYSSLSRTRHTRAQSNLSRRERQRNLEAAFRADLSATRYRPGAPGPPVRCVALVDDVMTTGATLASASLALQQAGVEQVHCWVLAHTELKDGQPSLPRPDPGLSL